MFVNGNVVWKFFVNVVVDIRGGAKCIKAFFIDVEEVRREWDGLSCEVWK
jgi:hypothetical protein